MRMTRRWLVPLGVAAVVALVSALPHAGAAHRTPGLAAMTPADLLASVRSAPVPAFSGTVRINAALGLPSLPDGLANNTLGLVTLLTGAHDLQVSADGPQRQRIAMLGNLSETDLVHNGSDLWTYDSSRNEVTHRTLRHGQDRTPATSPPETPEPTLDPVDAAHRLLDKLDPTTAVTTDGTTQVAGLPAYVLVLTPRTPGTLVGSVRIAVGAANRTPLQVQVIPAGATNPALTVGFTHVTFSAPSPDKFRFTPPAGATVSEVSGNSATPAGDNAGTPSRATFGTGWATIYQVPAALIDNTPEQASGRDRHGLSMIGSLNRIATPVPQGHVLTTRLFSLLITTDGRLFIGAVPVEALEAAATAPVPVATSTPKPGNSPSPSPTETTSPSPTNTPSATPSETSSAAPTETPTP
jgi:outer membrane lipoprotein-sorting protein